jgi:ankyrin repeat protein
MVCNPIEFFKHGLTRLPGSVKAVEMLLQHRAKINTLGKEGRQALHYAAIKNRPLAVTCLLDWSADIEAKTDNGETPLFLAAKEGSFGTVKALGLRGANPDARCNLRNTPLHMAALHGTLPSVQFLISYGALPAAEGQFERQAIHLATRKNHPEITEYLIKNDPECVFALDEDHFTPLHAAAEGSHVGIAKILLQHGANPLAKTRSAKTPRELALGTTQWRMTQVLKDAELRAKENLVKHPTMGFLGRSEGVAVVEIRV